MKTILIIILINITTMAMAKEVELTLKINSKYPMKVHYNFKNTKDSYGSGDIDLKVNNEPEHIYVNSIPSEDEVIVHIDKMNAGNRTVFNDPCEIKLGKHELKTVITVGFKGNPKTHGSFTCFVSKN